MTTTIHLNQILLQDADLTVAGEKFYDLVKNHIAGSEKVVVDMENVTSLPSIFLNVSFGRIIDEYGMEAVRQLFTFVKITKIQAERLKKYFSSYKN